MPRIDPFYRRFGETFKQHRERRKLTQDDIAKAVGLSRTSITNIECGRQKLLLHQVFDLAAAVGVPPSALLVDLTSSSGDGSVDRAVEVAKSHVKNARELDWIKKTVAGDKQAKN